VAAAERGPPVEATCARSSRTTTTHLRIGSASCAVQLAVTCSSRDSRWVGSGHRAAAGSSDAGAATAPGDVVRAPRRPLPASFRRRSMIRPDRGRASPSRSVIRSRGRSSWPLPGGGSTQLTLSGSFHCAPGSGAAAPVVSTSARADVGTGSSPGAEADVARMPHAPSTRRVITPRTLRSVRPAMPHRDDELARGEPAGCLLWRRSVDAGGKIDSRDVRHDAVVSAGGANGAARVSRGEESASRPTAQGRSRAG
jgi:hypothetical protein